MDGGYRPGPASSPTWLDLPFLLLGTCYTRRPRDDSAFLYRTLLRRVLPECSPIQREVSSQLLQPDTGLPSCRACLESSVQLHTACRTEVVSASPVASLQFRRCDPRLPPNVSPR